MLRPLSFTPRIGCLLALCVSLACGAASCWLLALGVQAQPIAQLSDRELTAAVESELVQDPSVPHDEVKVSAHEGIVTLKGTVGNLLARDHAKKLAQTVRGVRSVVSRIEVHPRPLRTDEQLQRDVEAALAYDAASDSYEIEVSVEDKVATLRGRVQSFAERLLATQVALGVAGLRDVKEELRLSAPPRSDGEVLSEIRSRLRWDGYVGHDFINVGIEAGVVELSGRVGSDAERSRAHFDAWVTGVKNVDATKLTVDPSLKSQRARSAEPHVSDREIVEAVNAALRYDPRVKSYNLRVEVRARVVTLRGFVDNLHAKRAALHDARATAGVARVVDRVRVKSSREREEQTAEGIRRAFERDPYLERFEVLVKVAGGTAYLTGAVDGSFEKLRADQIASRAVGVQRVRNDLTVSGENKSPLAIEPHLDPLP